MKRLLLILILVPTIIFAQHNDSVLKKSLQVKWINKALKEFKNSTSIPDLILCESKINSEPDNTRIEYTIVGNSKMTCANSEWIYFKTHSKHENEEIGDITLAVSNKGSNYVYFGHVCGGEVYFKNNSNTVPKDAKEFFTKFTSDSEHWIPWK